MSSEVEHTDERIALVPLAQIKPLPFNLTTIDLKVKAMLDAEMTTESRGLYKIDPIILRRMTSEEVEAAKKDYPFAKYEIVDGHTRVDIARRNGWQRIRAYILDVSRDEAFEINYRKNKERGTIDPVAEGIYFQRLVDKGIASHDIAAHFDLSQAYVVEAMKKAVKSKPARELIAFEAYKHGKLSGKLLETIASAPVEKQEALAEAIIDGKLKPKEAEKAKEAILSGASVEEAIKLAKTAKLEEEEAAAPIEAPPTIQPAIQPTIQPPAPAAAPERISAKPLATTNLQEITCPKCGAKAEINWIRREIIWQ